MGATSVHHFFFCSPTRASTILCSLATLLLRYIGTSFLLLFPHKSFHHTILSRYIATSLHRYIISSFVPPQELPPYYALPLHHYITTSLHRYIATSLHCYIATSLHRYIATSHILAYFGILWQNLARLWHTLEYSGIL